MSDAAPDRVAEVFRHAVALDPSERLAYLDVACRSDRGLRAEVESLLAHHRDETILVPPAWREGTDRERRLGPRLESTDRDVPSVTLLRGRRQFKIAAVAAALLLAALVVATRTAVHGSIRTIVTEKLVTILNVNITSLQLWLEREKEHAGSTALAPSVRNLLLEHIAAASGIEDLTAAGLANTLGALQDALRPQLRAGHRAVAFVDAAGRVLGGVGEGEEDAVGKQLSAEGMAFLGRLQEAGTPIISGPHHKGSMVSLMPSDLDVPMMLAWAPVLSTADRCAGALVFVIDPRIDITRVLSRSRPGETGEAYVLDDRGVFLSDSRFGEQLKSIGLIPPREESSATFRVRIADPGGNLTTGFTPRRSFEELPLTRMAAAAVAKRDGIDVDGYRNYLGVDVIGCWQWLDDYGFGVAVEMGRDEAFRPLRVLRVGSWLLLGLLALVTIGLFLFSRSVVRLRHDVRRAERFGQYTLVEKIGEGGVGEVWRARHALLKRPTAIKLLRPERTSEQAISRFEQEVQLTSRLTHPNTVAIYDFGRTSDGTFYYVMEYLAGETLAGLLKKAGRFPVGRAVHVVSQVCGSLEEAHGLGLIHRDIKPANIMLCERGGRHDVAKVLDFGLVKDVSRTDLAATAPDLISGTPLYVAPERLRDSTRNDARTDLYSLGVVAYELLTGQPLFVVTDLTDALDRTLNDVPEPPSRRAGIELPAGLEELVMSCLAKDPAKRPASAATLGAALNALEDVAPWSEQDARDWWERFRPAC